MKKLLLFVLSLIFSVNIYSQSCTSTVYYDNMETYTWLGNWWTPALTTGFFTNASVSSNTSAVIYGSGNGTSGIEQDWYSLPNITGLNPAYSYQLKFRLASYTFSSPTATTRGLDVADYLSVQVSTNGGVSYVTELRITGNSNATWPFTSTGTITHTANGTFTNSAAPTGDVYQAPAGATTTGPSTITLNLQPNITQVAVDLYSRVNSDGEEFWIDNVELIEIIPTPTITITGVNSVCNGTATTLTASGAQTYVWSGGITNGTPFTPVSTTTYSVTGTNTGMLNGVGTRNTCRSTTSRTITVNPNPTPSISGNFTICNGQSTTLTGNGGNTYNWSNGLNTSSISVSPTTSTNYIVTVTNGNGCTASTSSLVTVNPLPSPSINGSLIICNGQSTTLTASGGNTYSWSNSATSSTIIVSPTTTTNYVVVATTPFGCTASSSSIVQVKPTPNLPTLNPDTTICPSDFAVLYGSSNIGTLQWYDSLSGGTLLGTGSSFTTPLLSNNTSFYSQAELNGCVSPRATVNVIVDPNCILPIYLSTFDGHNEGRENHLYWLTEQEINSSHFEIERSNNGFDFVKIGIVECDPTKNYGFIDNTPYSGSNYYRLKMVDLDETFEYSSIIYLETQNKMNTKVFPNPFEDTLIYTYESEQNEELEVQVINILGQRVFQYYVNCQTCGNYITINTSNIPSGKYTIRIKHLTSLHETIQTIIKK